MHFARERGERARVDEHLRRRERSRSSVHGLGRARRVERLREARSNRSAVRIEDRAAAFRCRGRRARRGRRGRLPGRAGGSNARAGHLSAAGQLRRLALYAARALSMFSGCQAARARGLAAGALGVEGVAETSPGCEGLPAQTRRPSQTRWCFFRCKGRLGRRREPWRGREAPGEGWGGDASMQPVYLAKAKSKQNRALKSRFTSSVDVRLRACTA